MVSNLNKENQQTKQQTKIQKVREKLKEMKKQNQSDKEQQQGIKQTSVGLLNEILLFLLLTFLASSSCIQKTQSSGKSSLLIVGYSEGAQKVLHTIDFYGVYEQFDITT